MILFDKKAKLLNAITEGNESKVNRLIKSFNIDIPIDDRGYTPLMLAAENDHENLVLELLKMGADKNVKDYYGNPLICISAYNKHEKIFKILLDSGTDINNKDNFYGRTALEWADLRKQGKIVRYITSPKNINKLSQNTLENSLLCIAETGNIKEMEKRLKLKLNINVVDNTGTTPLIIAAYNGRKEMVELLISKKANINAKGENGYTALILATIYHKKEIVKLLLEKGAKKNIVSDSGQTAYDFAIEENQKAIASLLS